MTGSPRDAVTPRTVYYAAMSLDGFIADTEETLGWLMGYEPPEGAESEGPLDESFPAFMGSVGAMVMGGKTYDFVLSHDWPYGDLPCWVYTHRDAQVAEGASGLRFASGDVAEGYEEIIEAAGERDVWMVGGGDLASQYLEAGLLHVVRATVVPVVLGAGLPLFARPVERPMALRATEAFPNGMIELTYEVS